MSELAAAAAAPGWKTWLLAIRPKTLAAAVAPVVVGTGLALGHGAFRPLPALAALAGALLIQIGTNLTNDYYDFKKGADTAERVGPLRVTQAGLVAPQTVLRAAVGTFAAAIAVGGYLVLAGGWPIAVIGVLSVASGWAYTGGPYPLGYNGLGDVAVFVFFGLVAVTGTYFVQAGAAPPSAWLASIPVGAMATAILVVNNLRDQATDARAGKRTLVVRFGERAGQAEYVAMLAVAFAAPVALWVAGASPWCLLALGSIPLAAPPLSKVLRAKGPALNPALGETARLQMGFALLFAAGLWIS